MQNTVGRLLRSDTAWTVLTFAAMAGAAVAIAGGLLQLPTPVVLVGGMGVLTVAAILAQPYLGLMLFLGLHYLLGVIVPQSAVVESMRLPLCVSSLTLFAWLIHLLGKGERAVWTPHLGWMLLFTGAIVGSAYGLPDNEWVVDAILHSGRLALLFLLVQQVPRTEERFRLLLTAFLLFNVVLALSAVHGWWSGSSVLLDRGRLRAVVMARNFDDPNELAAHLVIAVPVALLFAVQAGSWGRRLWGAVSLGVLAIALLLSNSRGGLLAAGVAVVVFTGHRASWRVRIAAALGIGALLTVGHLVPTGESLTTDDSAMGRVEAWRSGLQMFQQNPLLGIGYEQFEVHHRIAAHNTLVHALAEGGFLLALGWVGIHYWALLTLFRVRKEGDPALSGYAAALQAGLLAALTAGMFLAHTYRLVPLIPVALAAALGMVAGKAARPRAADWPHYLAVPAITVAGIGLLSLVLRSLP